MPRRATFSQNPIRAAGRFGGGPAGHPVARAGTGGRCWAINRSTNSRSNCNASNPTLQAAAESYTQARDLAAEAESRLYPQVSAQAQVTDNRQSAHHLFSSSVMPKQQASNAIGAAASWEPDFWHAFRNSAHVQKRLAQASAADLATARLSLEAELANDYIALRGLDAELQVLHQSIVAYQKAVEVARLRAQGKIASGLILPGH